MDTGKASISAADAERFRYVELTSYLRLGEIDNCLARHNRDCCLFPLQEGGLHRERQGFENAEKLILEELRRHPQSLSYRWLLTVVSMGLDKYPQGSDPTLVLSANILASECPFPPFPERAKELGVVVDDIAGGAIADDFNNDGWLDIVLSSWSKSGQLRFLVNDRSGRFVERTREAGLEGITGGLNLFQADYDNDGFLDVYIVHGAWLDRGGRDPDSLLRNNGDGTFVDRTESSGLLSYEPALTAVWADVDNDGWIDLYVGCETMAETRYPAKFYQNQKGRFVECGQASGLALTGLIRGLAAGDYGNDGWVDLYVSRLGQPNVLLRNQGRAVKDGPGWRFEPPAIAPGVAEPIHSFPCWFWDYENDGWLDIFVSGYTLDFSEKTLEDLVKDMVGQPCRIDKPRLYRNRGDGTFEDVSRAARLDRVIYAMGANFGDLDGDGWLDFYAGTGDPNLTTLIPNRMFRSDGGKRFLDVTTNGRFGHLQ